MFDQNGILAVGKGLQAPDAEILDTTNKIVMPGFVDLHDHLFQTGIRGCGSDKDVNGWLAQCVRPLERLNLSESEVYDLVRLSTAGVISMTQLVSELGVKLHVHLLENISQRQAGELKRGQRIPGGEACLTPREIP